MKNPGRGDSDERGRLDRKPLFALEVRRPGARGEAGKWPGKCPFFFNRGEKQ